MSLLGIPPSEWEYENKELKPLFPIKYIHEGTVKVSIKNYAGKWKHLFNITPQFASLLIETNAFPDLWKFEDT